MKKGTMYVKMGGREETYWVCSLFVCGVLYYFLNKVIVSDTAAIAALALMVASVVVRYTLLRSWFTRTIEWTLDDETLVFDGEVIDRRRIHDVSFKRNRLSNGAWYLTIDCGKRIRVESLSALGQSKRSLFSMTELADALRPRLKNPPKAKR